MAGANDERYERGSQRISEIFGERGTNTVAPLGELGRYIAEFAYGDIYGRPGLVLRDRQIVTIALLIGLGGAEHELKTHMLAGIKAGLSVDEIDEIIIQSVSYVGFPKAIAAKRVLNDIVAEMAD